MRILTKDTIHNIGKVITLMGWVAARRDHGKLIFIDLRDRWGVVQVVFTTGNKTLLAQANRIRPEWVVKLQGFVKERPKTMVNPHIPTGTVEIEAMDLEILNEAENPPFAVDTDGYEIGEEHRLEYRYLDLRRTRLAKNIRLRDETFFFIREFLRKKEFLEIETPILTKSTPEGARDYLVPSRLYPGQFYALPQSPQQYKQLLMAGGVERYFQIARCFRDEDTRGDRQPEFTQLDLEMSFIEQEDVMAIIEELVAALVRTVTPEKKISAIPFPRISRKEALKKYGTDRPDARQNPEDRNELAFSWVVDFPVFEKDEKTKKLTYAHNPFTAPKKECMDDLRNGKNLDELLSEQYDLALNGFEIGGGGIRIHDAEILEKVFEVLGHSKETIRGRFGHMLDAFRRGTPPHGGIALGLDRFMMLLAGEPNIREVIAFPKTGDARDLMMRAPSKIESSQLKELGLMFKAKS